MFSKGLLQKYSTVFSLLARLADAFTIVLAGWLTYGMLFESFELPSLYFLTIVVAVLVAALVFPQFRLYEPWRGARLATEARALMLAWIVAALCMALIGVLTKAAAEISRLWMVAWFVGAALLMTLVRIVLRESLRIARALGHNQRRIVLVGTGGLAQEVANRVMSSRWTGLRLLGFFDDEPEAMPGLRYSRPLLGDFDALPRYLETYGVDEVWIAVPWRQQAKIERALHALRHSATNVRMVPDIYSYNLLNHSITEVAGLPVLNLSATPLQGINGLLKALEDRVLAALILLLIWPLMVVIAIGVKLSSPGPVFYRQERVGLNNRPFMMLKFRSMPVDAEAKTGPVWAKPGEQRATRFGAFLRRTSLDELPQFINVLKGEMSIVGPRPERPVFVEQFKEKIPQYMQKHLVKAGITGWAQVNGWRGNTDLQKRIEHDLYYIENWSLWFDLKIIFLTLFKGMRHPNAY